jgi:predicted DNA-binding transcriptional regulator AlpA
MVNVLYIAEQAQVSTRTVARRVKDGLIPAPVKFGGLNRWPRTQIDGWIAAGCPAVGSTPSAA